MHVVRHEIGARGLLIETLNRQIRLNRLKRFKENHTIH